jgi:hypothetical protein
MMMKDKAFWSKKIFSLLKRFFVFYRENKSFKRRWTCFL